MQLEKYETFGKYWKCLRCGYSWAQKREEKPRLCANQDCKSPYWDKERRK